MPAVHIYSDSLLFDNSKKEKFFIGNVICFYESISLYADKMNIYEHINGNQLATAEAKNKNKSVIFYINNLKKSELIKGNSSKLELDFQTGKLSLIGNAIITRYFQDRIIEYIEGNIIIYFQSIDKYHTQHDFRKMVQEP
ncbi:MAG: hypothetical protein IR526_03460 [Bordetella sp.]|nr:MAG: hypothetical protein IR526_03460 [Bordetella sp.]